ncbi:hypothetical protein A3D05_03450 [Candidatus Gottesmanbacteria bacterium RIFCSPHIGHO2_02_FULL_40_24]|uniref:SGNH hydrolase-type esterase domain-containing protein n=1 Tax=Candidatus Gottesmanbacteria bacterium RIFCSPHIGHO2_01_FULL_40_15 TaxID=1798376 RepID=A0A1F5Z1K3_9BACT|nr:MAG: hypothetical protein A2777_02575 [Candidatus Gottesmanbacteria bacterium RIFCSPHIGHO2_01_FULL_40_15]OGG17889.1 MAG: hypothetical protein A3D05_03450 [Candidatus Gottesmanbacteria bacterium RIFCSPHIGHO2_02_FULL_40_24]OGG21756.1 MAG: hypothetical protein A3B48_03600 [Candidatus Gottesmanbacteria bacterium RIFCSPLOWO2_01_FULL_40_10]
MFNKRFLPGKIFRRIIFLFFLPLTTLLILYFTDKFIGKFVIKNEMNIENEFVLPPNSKALYKNQEFNFTVETNKIGFRGKNYQIPKSVNTFRILAIGDSFTYGWGTNNIDIWTTLLENKLANRFKDKKVEIFNIGKPGLSPRDYLENVKNYTKLYNPNIILVGIVEGDDIGQLTDWPKKRSTANPETREVKKKLINTIVNNQEKKVFYSDEIAKISQIFIRLFPNFHSIVSPYREIDVKPANLSNLKIFINNLGDEEAARFQTAVKKDVQSLYLNGSINPVLFTYALFQPDFFTAFLNYRDSRIKTAISELTVIIDEINQIAKDNKSIPIIVDIPYGIFVSEAHMKTSVDMGFKYAPDALISNYPVDMLKQIASNSGITIIDNLKYFREKCSDDCFFNYDSHLNIKGNRILADRLEDILISYINENK